MGSISSDPGQTLSEPLISENVYVQGLPIGTSEESATSTFAEFGKVVSIKLLEKPNLPVSALIRFADTEAASLVKEILNGAQPEGFPGPLKVRFANAQGATSRQPSSDTKGLGQWQQQQPQQQGKIQGDNISWSTGAQNSAGCGGCRGVQQNWGGGGKDSCGSGNKGCSKGSGGCDADTLVNLVKQSGYLPGGNNYRNDNASVCVVGLPRDADEHQMYRMFSPYGAMHSVFVSSSGSTVYAFINYLDVQSAEASCVAYNGMEMPTGGWLKASIRAKQGQVF